MLKIGFSILSSQQIGSSLVSFEMIFEALQSEVFWLEYYKHKTRFAWRGIPELKHENLGNQYYGVLSLQRFTKVDFNGILQLHRNEISSVYFHLKGSN